jgi:formylglycine-generating enzyme required for sulfatase activity
MGSQESPEHTAAFFKVTTSRGSPADQFRHEHPQHRVRITRPFYLGTYHVTRGQFRKFVEDTGYQTDAERGGGAQGLDIEHSRLPRIKVYTVYKDRSWRKVGYEQPDHHPVVNVSWNDAMAFCRWLSGRERKSYRLPTEAEWEYACRAGTTTRYYSGDDAFGPNTMPAKVREATRAEGMTLGAEEYAFTAPVGTLGPNPFGLYDMHGNARQWCADRYDAEYYAKSPAEDPPGPPSGWNRVIRGSFSESPPMHIRCAHRDWNNPCNRHFGTGFRVARTN